MPLFGGIEAGGTKFVCGVGTGPEDLITTEIPTTTPAATVTAAIDWLKSFDLTAIGIGSFGPVDINPDSPTWGFITTTPKPAWRNYDFAGAVRSALGIPVYFNSDVNAAILGEARWGAARHVSNCLYLTVGTGIGGGALSSGRLLHGASHPEMGHILIPHDLATDPFPGLCPFHADCLEGLASGPAIEARWHTPARELPTGHPAWNLEAKYLALGLANYACTFAPERILIGGGVMRQKVLLNLIRQELARLLSGYIAVPEVLAPHLDQHAGVLGALALARG